MKKYIILAMVAALVFALLIPTACAKKEGVLPTWSIGDKWVFKGILEDTYKATFTFEVTGEDVIDGTNCYLVKVSQDPPIIQFVIEDLRISTWYDKATMYPVRTEVSGNLPMVVFKGSPFHFVSNFLS